MNRWRLLRSPVHFFSLGGGLGLMPFAPGTFGTLPGFALAGLARGLAVPLQALLIALLVMLGIRTATLSARALQVADPGAVVCDEFVAFAGLLLCLPVALSAQVWAFLLFRLFDAVKPFPVSWADRHVHGGLGIMLDDVLAAILAGLVYLGLRWLHLPGGPM